MIKTRRNMLKLVGGGAVLAVAVPAAVFVSTRTPTQALKPWDLAGQYADPRMRALSFALLAPNPHNLQPWVAELVSNDTVIIHKDKSLNLPVTDPFGRQLTIGMGCFLELMEIAATQELIEIQTQLFPHGEDGPVAVCKFIPDAASLNPLFQHVLLRRSHRKPFDSRAVLPGTVQALHAHADVFLDSTQTDVLKRLAHKAWMTEVNTPAAWKESIDLLRIGKAEINANPDGINVGGPFLDTLATLGLFNKEDALDIDNSNTRVQIEATANTILSAPAITLTRTQGNDRMAQIDAGRRWLRLNLAATGSGLALRPVSQALQEYPELRKQYEEIHRNFATDGKTIQMLGLLGYGKTAPRSPRWSIHSKMKNA